MKTDTIKAAAESAEGTLFLGDDWFDPLETGVRTRIRGFIEELLEAELDGVLGRNRYERRRLGETGVAGRPVVGAGHRHGHRERQLMGTFGPATVRVPRARLDRSDGQTVEWRNATIPAYVRRVTSSPRRSQRCVMQGLVRHLRGPFGCFRSVPGAFRPWMNGSK